MSTTTSKERVFSGIQPSGEIHVGNYLGAIRNWVSLLDGMDCIFCVVDYHALTSPVVPAEMPQRVFEAVVAAMSCGLDPERCTIFVQSHVPEHTELCWLFNTVTPLGSMFRMTQFKDKSRSSLRHRVETAQASPREITMVAQELKRLTMAVQDRLGPIIETSQGLKGKPKTLLEPIREANDRLGELMQFLQVKLGISEAGMGLLDYPILQAADILLYKATRVPVGEDQDQHIELCREIAERFNAKVGREIFPAAQVLRSPTPRIRGMNGSAKMSKSLDNHLGVLWEEGEIWERLKGAYTDPEKLRRGDPGRPEICNIYTLHEGLTAADRVAEIKTECLSGSLGCVDCKEILLRSMVREFTPAREMANELRGHPERVREVLSQGAERCRGIARETLAEAREALGLRGGPCDPEK
jgi:tryptophanyl-tRNA synthetase